MSAESGCGGFPPPRRRPSIPRRMARSRSPSRHRGRSARPRPVRPGAPRRSRRLCHRCANAHGAGRRRRIASRSSARRHRCAYVRSGGPRRPCAVADERPRVSPRRSRRSPVTWHFNVAWSSVCSTRSQVPRIAARKAHGAVGFVDTFEPCADACRIVVLLLGWPPGPLGQPHHKWYRWCEWEAVQTRQQPYHASAVSGSTKS